MKPSLLSVLKCPECKGDLNLLPGAASGSSAEVQTAPEGLLACPAGHRFPVLRGIPRFVPGEQYAGSFGFEWNVFNRTQLDSAPAAGPTSEPSPSGPQSGTELVNYAGFIARKGKESYDTFYHKTGLSPEDLKGKRVLDAGCGTGRFAEVAAAAGAEVFACDLSLAVEACHKNLGHLPNVHVVQADIFRLPFAPETFDIIYSLGVLHHTPDTRKAFLNLPPLLKSGGKLCAWVYAKSSWSKGIIPPWHFMSDFYRRWTSRWPPKRLLRYSKFRAKLHPILRIPLLGKIFDRLWPGSVHPDYEWRVLDTFDWYSPVYQWKHTDEELESWFREAGMQDIRRLPFPVSGQAKKR